MPDMAIKRKRWKAGSWSGGCKVVKWFSDGSGGNKFCRYYKGIEQTGDCYLWWAEIIKRGSGAVPEVWHDQKKHWSPTTVSAIVRDEIYIGTRIWGKTRCSMHTGHKAVLNDETEWVRLENHHTAIIDRELFEKQMKCIRKEEKCCRITHQFYSGKT